MIYRNRYCLKTDPSGFGPGGLPLEAAKTLVMLRTGKRDYRLRIVYTYRLANDCKPFHDWGEGVSPQSLTCGGHDSVGVMIRRPTLSQDAIDF